MKIKKLTANFGNLNNETLELSDGLNIITMPNEAGKSTWSSFILAMLYGVDTSQKDRQDRLADKNRFNPWAGGKMSGSAELEYGGRIIRIERGGSGDAMRGFKAVYCDSGDNVKELSSENAGEVLTGLPRAVYERSAFIRQDGLPVDPAPELEQRLQTLVSAQDGSLSYSDAQKRLQDWKRSLKSSRGGEIPGLESEIAEKERIIGELEKKGERLADARAVLHTCEQELAAARVELENHRLIEEYERSRELARARLELHRIENNIKKCGFRPYDRADLRALERSEIEVRGLHAEAERLGREKAELLAECENVEVHVPAVFRGLTPSEAQRRALKDTADCAALKAAAEKKTYVVIAAFLLALFAAFCVAAVLRSEILFAPAALILAAVVAVFFLGRKRASAAAAGARGLVDAYGAADFMQIANEYAEEQSSATESARRCAEAVERYESARARALEAERALLAEASRVLGGEGTLDELTPALQSALESVTKNEELAQKYEAAKALVESLSRTQKDDSGKYELKSIPSVNSTKQEAEQALILAQDNKDRAMRAVSQLEGELAAAGDIDILRARLSRLRSRLEAAAVECEALETAAECLTEAEGQLRRRFSPILNDRAGKYFQELTAGRYKSLYVEKSFAAGATEAGGTVSRDRRSLSAGTVAQMYLAVRLAMSSILGDEKNLPPLILDDALCTFDDQRMGLALETLEKIAEERQVILFTCQSREAEYTKAYM